VHVNMFQMLPFINQSLSNIYLWNIMKIRASISTKQNINILLICSFAVLSKLKALQLSKVSLSNIKHQHSKNLPPWAGQKPLVPKTHKHSNCLHEFARKRCAKCAPFSRTYAWTRFLHWSIAVSIISYS